MTQPPPRQSASPRACNASINPNKLVSSPDRCGTIELLRLITPGAVFASFGVDTPTVSFSRDTSCSRRAQGVPRGARHAGAAPRMMYLHADADKTKTIALRNGSELETHGEAVPAPPRQPRPPPLHGRLRPSLLPLTLAKTCASSSPREGEDDGEANAGADARDEAEMHVEAARAWYDADENESESEGEMTAPQDPAGADDGVYFLFLAILPASLSPSTVRRTHTYFVPLAGSPSLPSSILLPTSPSFDALLPLSYIRISALCPSSTFAQRFYLSHVAPASLHSLLRTIVSSPVLLTSAPFFHARLRSLLLLLPLLPPTLHAYFLASTRIHLRPLLPIVHLYLPLSPFSISILSSLAAHNVPHTPPRTPPLPISPFPFRPQASGSSQTPLQAAPRTPATNTKMKAAALPFGTPHPAARTPRGSGRPAPREKEDTREPEEADIVPMEVALAENAYTSLYEDLGAYCAQARKRQAARHPSAHRHLLGLASLDPAAHAGLRAPSCHSRPHRPRATPSAASHGACASRTRRGRCASSSYPGRPPRARLHRRGRSRTRSARRPEAFFGGEVPGMSPRKLGRVREAGEVKEAGAKEGGEEE
ncbi:hypothetical protein DFH09DRAFT_1360177 [Mycena vulgaris]|nr:hypothetical protein DFH09DRAFT_1360177 [Mycena vulgaris]